MLADLNTLPKLLLNQASLNGAKTAVRKKEFGIWHAWTWMNVAEEVRAFACGLAARGFVRGDHLAVVGDIRARLYWAIVAAQSLGGIAVPLYSEASHDDIAGIINEIGGERCFIVVQDQEQVDKLLQIITRCSSLREIIFCDPRGMRHYNEPCLAKYEEIRSAGQEFDRKNPNYFIEQVGIGVEENVAFILHTSGATSDPRAVMLSHHNLIRTAENSIAQLKLTADDECLAFLPMAMTTSVLFYLVQPLVAGFCVNFPERSETVLSDMREVGPTFFFAPPNFYKGLVNKAVVRMADASVVKRLLFRFVLERTEGSAPTIAERLLMTSPLKNALGLSRIRVALTTGDFIAPAVHRFYQRLGINVRKFYGPTEGCGFVSLQSEGSFETPTSVGAATTSVEIDITDQGEVIFAGPGSSRGSRNLDPLSHASGNGWIRTGDAGFVDQHGTLCILGAIAHKQRLTHGKEFFPLDIERKLKSSPYIGEAIALGHGRPCVTSLISINVVMVAHWAKQRKFKYSGSSELAQHDAVYELISEIVSEINEEAHQSGNSYLQIRRFVIVPNGFDAKSGQVTFTGKLRRAVIEEQYADLIDAMYEQLEDDALSTASDLDRRLKKTTSAVKVFAPPVY